MTRDEAKNFCQNYMLSGNSFTFIELTKALRESANGANSIDGSDTWRIAYSMIKKFHKKGVISFVRKGRDSIWSLTDAGRALVEADQ